MKGVALTLVLHTFAKFLVTRPGFGNDTGKGSGSRGGHG